jgi:type I site-specific restriction endonuclease
LSAKARSEQFLKPIETVFYRDISWTSGSSKDFDFAKDDNHAEEIVTQVMQVFGKGNDFAAKITYNAKDPKKLFRISVIHQHYVLQSL